MKPMVCPLDIKLAYDPDFTWDSTYTFDNKKILKEKINEKDEEKKEHVIPNITSLQITYIFIK
jgi:hypothetical protein